MKVVKFGGTSLADGATYEKVVKIIQDDPERTVIVTSAPGKRFQGDIKVTDLLIRYANQVCQGEDATATVKEILGRYSEIATHFGLPAVALTPLQAALEDLPKQDYPNQDYLMAAFKAHGERLNARLMALVLTHVGMPARFVDPSECGLEVTGTPNDATISPHTYGNLHAFKYDPNQRLVFPGFFGFTPAGRIATFARGGSDTTGAILACGLRARLYENFTDVDAIYTANPNIVDNPQPIRQMTYREMRELSYAGFSVFQDEALIPAIQGQVPINVKNTNAPQKPGTMIVPEKGFKPEDIITGIAGGAHFAALYLHKYLINKENGFTLRLLSILQRHGISYEHMPSGIDDVTVIINRNQISDEQIDLVCNEIQCEINPDQLKWIPDYAITMIVGEGMRTSLGVIEDVLAPLAEAHVEVPMINQGASQISIMIGTRAKDADKTVKAIYDRFFIH
ncbi:aspartate kinase [Limosilactobacillus fermentum]|uniref:aspartate kinase n=1 Tax=Limosilactobacillus fermentum TaxID=1613 RepID=UPI00214DE69A|nr:aspartate kinase [Limosilactobacillus fermentum]UUV95451.1 aspartate kinase [Limosilactobacillus fermentum]